MPFTSGQINSATGGIPVTPSDSTVLPAGYRAIYVGGAGDVALQMADQSILTFKGLAVGTLLPVQFTKVMATNTTATNLLALS